MSGDGLPKPHEGMTPEEKGVLLLRYVRARKPMPWPNGTPLKDDWKDTWDKLDFKQAHFDGANLNEAHLEGADLLGVRLKNAYLRSAHLEGADLGNAHLEGADLFGAHLAGTYLRDAHLEGARLSGTTGTPRDRRSSYISAETYIKSGWNPATLLEWMRAGAILVDFENLPENVQEALKQNKEGLTLYFPAALPRLDRFLIEGVIVGLLGRDTDCEVVEYTSSTTGSHIRLTASDPNDLLVVAKVLYEKVWSGAGGAAGLLRTTLATTDLRDQLTGLANRIDWMELWARQEDGALQEVKNLADLLGRLVLSLEDGAGRITITNSTIGDRAVIGPQAQGADSQRAGGDLTTDPG